MCMRWEGHHDGSSVVSWPIVCVGATHADAKMLMNLLTSEENQKNSDSFPKKSLGFSLCILLNCLGKCEKECTDAPVMSLSIALVNGAIPISKLFQSRFFP